MKLQILSCFFSAIKKRNGTYNSTKTNKNIDIIKNIESLISQHNSSTISQNKKNIKKADKLTKKLRSNNCTDFKQYKNKLRLLLQSLNEKKQSPQTIYSQPSLQNTRDDLDQLQQLNSKIIAFIETKNQTKNKTINQIETELQHIKNTINKRKTTKYYFNRASRNIERAKKLSTNPFSKSNQEKITKLTTNARSLINKINTKPDTYTDIQKNMMSLACILLDPSSDNSIQIDNHYSSIEDQINQFTQKNSSNELLQSYITETWKSIKVIYTHYKSSQTNLSFSAHLSIQVSHQMTPSVSPPTYPGLADPPSPPNISPPSPPSNISSLSKNNTPPAYSSPSKQTTQHSTGSPSFLPLSPLSKYDRLSKPLNLRQSSISGFIDNPRYIKAIDLDLSEKDPSLSSQDECIDPFNESFRPLVLESVAINNDQAIEKLEHSSEKTELINQIDQLIQKAETYDLDITKCQSLKEELENSTETINLDSFKDKLDDQELIIEAQVEEREEQITTIQTDLDEIKNTISTITSNLQHQHSRNKKLENLKYELEQRSEFETKQREKIKELESEKSDHKKKCNELKLKKEDLNKKLQQIATKLDELYESLIEKNEEIDSLDKQIQAEDTKLDELYKSLDEKNEEIDSLDKQIQAEETASEVKELNQELINVLQEDINELNSEINSFETKQETLENNINNATTSQNSIQQLIDQIESRIKIEKNKQCPVSTKDYQDNELKKRIDSARLSLEELELKINELKDKIASNSDESCQLINIDELESKCQRYKQTVNQCKSEYNSIQQIIPKEMEDIQKKLDQLK